jgi:hypothetical protein
MPIHRDVELDRIQGMIDLSADLLKDAKRPRQREVLVRQLSYYLRRKRELEFNQACPPRPRSQ